MLILCSYDFDAVYHDENVHFISVCIFKDKFGLNFSSGSKVDVFLTR